MTLNGPSGCIDITTTNAEGRYTFKRLANGTYTVMPSKTGCSFTPPSRSVTIAGASVRKVNFTGTCP